MSQMTPVRAAAEPVAAAQTPDRRRSFGTIVSPEEAARKQPRVSFSQNYQQATTRRTLHSPTGDNAEEDEVGVTQAFAFSHHSQCEDDNNQERALVAFVRDAVDGVTTTLYPSSANDSCRIYTIGRSVGGPNDDVIVSLDSTSLEVSRQHAELQYYARDESFQLQTFKRECFILNDMKKWITVPANSSHSLHVGDTFRLLPYNPATSDTKGVQFSLETIHTTASNLVGSAAMDVEYLRLLRTLKRKGQHQDNRKGGNTTLREPFTMSLNLQSLNNDPDNLLPILTLRKLFPHAAILEAVWYLRGENHVKFLQRLHQTFWDKQAHAETGWTGYNYGLLTTYPASSNETYINPLEENVIKPLVAGKTSRNMVCTLTKPDEETVQQACTSSIQFAVSQKGQLDLTVTQRSSDVILGLPHDVIVWSTILHLVRREVRLRSNSGVDLQAGMLHFNFSAGGAHYYDINVQTLETLLDREPKSNAIPPHLVIDESLARIGLFELANTYDDPAAPGEGKAVAKLRVSDYRNFHGHIKVEQAT